MVDISFAALEPKYAHLWETCTLLPSRQAAAQATANKILANRSRYETVSQATTVPWFVIGLIHMMEAGGDFSKHLHNGDPLTARTKQVPRGRPKTGKPPFTWEESAIDALAIDGLDKVGEWTPPRLCYQLEGYNGWGYAKYHPSVNTPYLWSGTNHYIKGKYVKDGKYDPNAVSGQSGAIAILKCVMARDSAVAELLEPKPIQVAEATIASEIQPLAGPVTPAKVKDLAPVSRKLWWLLFLRNKVCGWVGIGTGGVTVEGLLDPDGPAHNLAMLLKENAVWLLLGGFAVGAIIATVLISYIVEDYNNGNYVPSKGAQDV